MNHFPLDYSFSQCPRGLHHAKPYCSSTPFITNLFLHLDLTSHNLRHCTINKVLITSFCCIALFRITASHTIVNTLIYNVPYPSPHLTRKVIPKQYWGLSYWAFSLHFKLVTLNSMIIALQKMETKRFHYWYLTGVPHNGNIAVSISPTPL